MEKILAYLILILELKEYTYEIYQLGLQIPTNCC